MHQFASFNYQILSPSEININAISSAALYGKGVFTTIAIYHSKLFLWEKHWRRLNDNAEKLGINLSDFTEQKILDSLEEIIGKNRIKNGRCRLTFLDESPGKIWQISENQKTGLLIQTADLREVKPYRALTVSPFPINSASPLAGVKSCNYLENMLALEEAKAGGFDEAVRLNEREEITSAAMANIFWIKNEKIFTPGLRTGCLSGTTREFLLDNFEVFETAAKLTELKDADEIFLTSAGIGLSLASFEKIKKKPSTTFLKLKQVLDLKRFKA